MTIRIGLVFLFAIGLCAPLVTFAGCDAPAPAERLYSAPNALLREYDFSANGLVKIHDYGYGSLVQLVTTDGLPANVQMRIRAVEDPAEVAYSSFSARFDPSAVPSLSGYPPGVYLLALFGPLDLGVRAQLSQTGLRILDSAVPYGFLVQGAEHAISNALALCTSEVYRFVRAIYPFPIEARMSGLLAKWASGSLDVSKTNLVGTSDGGLVVRVSYFEGADSVSCDAMLLSFFGQAPPEYSNAFIAYPDKVNAALKAIPDIAYIEPLSIGGPSNNIAVRGDAMNFVTNRGNDSVTSLQITPATAPGMPSVPTLSATYQEGSCSSPAANHYPISIDTRLKKVSSTSNDTWGYVADYSSTTVTAFNFSQSSCQAIPVGLAPFRVVVQPVPTSKQAFQAVKDDMTGALPTDFTQPAKQGILVGEWENVQHLQETQASPQAVLSNMDNFQQHMNNWVTNGTLSTNINSGVDVYRAIYLQANPLPGNP